MPRGGDIADRITLPGDEVLGPRELTRLIRGVMVLVGERGGMQTARAILA